MTGDARASAWLVMGRFVRDRYLTLDRRVMGVVRIGLGLTLLGDLAGRLSHATLFYSNSGCLTNHFALFTPLARPCFSIFLCCSTPGEACVALVLTAVVFASYLVGYRTRLAQALSLFLYTSLNARNLLLENEGTVLVGIVLAWTLFLPLGDRFSVDAFVAQKHGAPRPPPTAHVGMAALAIALQVATIYAFHLLRTTGSTWGSGEAFHLVLWQNRIATPFAAWLRMHEPLWLSPALTKAAILAQGLTPFLLLTPVGQRYARTASFLVTTALCGAVAMLVAVGPLPYAMIALGALLLPKEAADWAAKRWAAVFGTRIVVANGDDRALARPSDIRVWLREACVAALVVASGAQAARDNLAVAPMFRLARPSALAAVIDYPRLLQRWSLFVPDAPEMDGTVVVDGVTADGRHIDPFTGQPPDLFAPLHGPFRQGPLLADYFRNIPEHVDHQRDLAKYLSSWQEIEGRPSGDRLVSLTAYWVYAESPMPGETVPRNVARRVLFSESPTPERD